MTALSADMLMLLVLEDRVPASGRRITVDADLANDLASHPEFCDATGMIPQHDNEDISQAERDAAMQAVWHLPERIRAMTSDAIRALAYDKSDAIAGTDIQRRDAGRARIDAEMDAYVDAGLCDILRFVLHFVETCRKHDQMIGVGRGSSVSSYVLFLLGAHRIDSLAHGLDFAEFLRADE